MSPKYFFEWPQHTQTILESIETRDPTHPDGKFFKRHKDGA